MKKYNLHTIAYFLKNISFFILLFFILGFFQSLKAQFIDFKIQEYNDYLKGEKTYSHTNQTLYKPGDIIYYTSYVSQNNLTPTHLSDILYVELISPSGRVISEKKHFITNGISKGSIELNQDLNGGIYKLKFYTKWMKNFFESEYYKEITVLKTNAPRLLMELDIEKESYGPNQEVKADLSIRNTQNIPLKNISFNAVASFDGVEYFSTEGITDSEGRSTLKFYTPQQLNSLDGTLNIIFEYEQNKESITRPIPIVLNSIDLQFLPEGGNYLFNQESVLAFKALTPMGIPADVSGFIVDEKNTTITSFESFHQGMGKIKIKPKKGKKYYAKITEPFLSDSIIELPSASEKGITINLTQKETNNWRIDIFSSVNETVQLMIRSNEKIFYKKTISIFEGSQFITLNTQDFPIGILQASLFKNNEPISERLFMNKPNETLQISIETEKESYKTREKVVTRILTKDLEGKPVSANLSVSVVNDKQISYLDDKQHTILSWLLMGSELKGEIYEPEFYFDDKEEKRIEALDLVMLTHGWRRYNWKDILDDTEIKLEYLPENQKKISGRVYSYKNNSNKKKPYPTQIYAIIDDWLYITESKKDGTFTISLQHPIKNAIIYAEKKIRDNIDIDLDIYDDIDNIYSYSRISENSWREENISTMNTENSSENLDILKSTEVDNTSNKKEKKKEGLVVHTLTSEIVDEEYVDDIRFLDAINSGEISELEGLLVVGYGVENSKSLSSVSILSENKINPTIQNALSGEVAGIDILNNTGQVGSSSNITIRGISSLYGSRASEPLLIVDGIPISSDNTNLNNIPPSDIESITILKDASATAIYGNNAANGVIIINTKKHTGRNQNYPIKLGKKKDLVMREYYTQNMYNINNHYDFYMPVYKQRKTQNKDDFRTCLYWNYNISTDENGMAQFYFYTSDETSVFRILAEGISINGIPGRKEASFSVIDDIQLEVKTPLYATEGDLIHLPLWIKNNTVNKIDAHLTIDLPRSIDLLDYKSSFTLSPQDIYTQSLPLEVNKSYLGKSKYRINILTDEFRNSVIKDIEVFGRGFPVHVGTSTIDSIQFQLPNQKPIKGTQAAWAKVYLNPAEMILKGLERIVSEPHGCFEQVSSSTYPNIYALQILNKETFENSVDLKNKAQKYLVKGYKKLANYEVSGGGFEWYGNSPAHEALSAFGLIQFYEMNRYVSIDKNMLERTQKWLLSRKDEKGGYKQNKGKYAFGGNRYVINNAYINYALSKTGVKEIEKQYETSLQEAQKSKDPYRMALVALTAFHLNKMEDFERLKNELTLIITSRGFQHLNTEGSITYSSGKSLKIETLSWYALVLMLDNNKLSNELNMVMKEIIQNGSGGYYGSTQATGLALKVISMYLDNYNTSAPKGDKLLLKINDEIVWNTKISDLLKEYENEKPNKNIPPSVLEKDILSFLKEGNNSIKMIIENNQLCFFDIFYDYRTNIPPNNEKVVVSLQTSLNQSTISVGENTQLTVIVKNKTNQAQPMLISKIGIPGGLTPEPIQLKRLMEIGKIDFYEIIDNFLVLYWYGIHPLESKEIKLELKAQVPGKYQGASSSTYLYYTEEYKNWNEGLKVKINE